MALKITSNILCLRVEQQNELEKIQRVVSANDNLGPTENLTNVFDAEDFTEHETFKGTDKIEAERLPRLCICDT